MKWTPEQIILAGELIDRRASNEDCLAAVGRSYAGCYAKIDRIRYGDRRAKYAPDLHRTEPRPDVPNHVIEDAIRRQKAARSITALICGDPPLGYSALDRR